MLASGTRAEETIEGREGEKKFTGQPDNWPVRQWIVNVVTHN